MPRLVSHLEKRASTNTLQVLATRVDVSLTVTMKRNHDGWPAAEVTATAHGRDGRTASASATEAHHTLPAKAAGRAAKRAVVKLLERLT